MKKLLLSTSALVGLAATGAFAGGNNMPAEPVAAAPANTGGLTVMVGGVVNSMGALVDQDDNANSTPTTAGSSDLSDSHIVNDAEIHVTAAGSTENFDYGAVVELNANVDSDAEQDGNEADKAYIFAESDDFGRVEFGSNSGASQTLEVDASTIARATGGIEGAWWNFVDTNGVSTATTSDVIGTGVGYAGLPNSVFRLEPNLPVAGDVPGAQDAAKITYYTPRFSGLQLGVSFTPDTGDVGSAANLSAQDNANQFENVYAGGVNFEQDFDGVGLMASIVGESGSAEVSNQNDLQAYSAGLGVSVEGFSVAGNYADLGDSGLATTASQDEQKYWTAGAAYENGPYGISTTYMNSEQSNGLAGAAGGINELDNIVVGADYQLAPGFTPYVEAAFFELDQAGATRDNDGNVIILGAELAF